MLQLKYLFHNKELALEILSRWNYDKNQPHLMEQFRISANAVYGFTNQDTRCFLRFAHAEEKSRGQILAELEFLNYLRTNNYPCLQPVLSKAGNELEVVDTPDGRYYGVVFLGVPGRSLSDHTLTPTIAFGWGKHLGRLHRLSKDYSPSRYRRVDHVAQLNWMAEVLDTFPEEALARRELEVVSDWLQRLPQNDNNYGLVHYDFETDNVFYNPDTENFYVIDFDDAVYHWFAMDVTTALASYEGSNRELAQKQFMAGYRTEHRLDDEWLQLRPGFSRYQNLYSYVRVIRSTKNQNLGEEPKWMGSLREKLAKLCIERSADFGKPM